MAQQLMKPAVTMMGDPLPNIPWEDRPANSKAVLWRYSGHAHFQQHLQQRGGSLQR
jgi:hypothetical protein